MTADQDVFLSNVKVQYTLCLMSVESGSRTKILLADTCKNGRSVVYKYTYPANLPWICTYFSMFVLPFFSLSFTAKMELSNWQKWSLLNFLYRILHEAQEDGVNVALLKEHKFGDHKFLFFSKRYYEIKNK